MFWTTIFIRAVHCSNIAAISIRKPAISSRYSMLTIWWNALFGLLTIDNDVEWRFTLRLPQLGCVAPAEQRVWRVDFVRQREILVGRRVQPTPSLRLRGVNLRLTPSRYILLRILLSLTLTILHPSLFSKLETLLHAVTWFLSCMCALLTILLSHYGFEIILCDFWGPHDHVNRAMIMVRVRRDDLLFRSKTPRLVVCHEVRQVAEN